MYGFVDWNADGDFDDAGETVTASVADGVTNATETLTFTVPLGAVTGTDLGTRFRLSTEPRLAAGGPPLTGKWRITSFRCCNDLGDLPDTSTGTGPGDYDTLLTTGPSHVITAGLGIGALIDAEADGQPNSTATGDDTTGLDDEDGFTAPAQIVAGQTVALTVDVTNTTATDAVLYGFVDWNNDGDFDDPGETATAASAVPSVPAPLLSPSPLPDAATGVDLGTRFRLSTDSTLTATGAAPDGEVEDYLLQVDALDLGDLPDTSTNTGTGDYDTLSPQVPATSSPLVSASVP